MEITSNPFCQFSAFALQILSRTAAIEAHENTLRTIEKNQRNREQETGESFYLTLINTE